MKTEAQQRVASRILTLVRSKQDSMRPEEILNVVRCTRSNTREVFEHLVTAEKIRVTNHGKVIAQPEKVHYETGPTQAEILDSCFILERAL